MNMYSYEAVDSDGQIVNGKLEANSLSEAVNQLGQRSLQIVSISCVPEATVREISQMSEFRKSVEQLLSEREQSALTMCALEAETQDKTIQREIQRIRRIVERDRTVDEFLADPQALKCLPLFTQHARTGRASERWIKRMTQPQAERVQRWQAFSYPITLLAISLAAFVFASVLIVPTFKTMYLEFELTLPWLTRCLLFISDQITLNLPRTLISLLIAVSLAVLTLRWWRSRALTNRWFSFLVAGSSSNLVAISKLSEMLAELLRLRASLPVACQLAASCCDHPHYRKATEVLANELKQAPNSINATTAKKLPHQFLMALQMEEPARIQTLESLTHLYGDRVDTRIDFTTAIFPVATIAAVGLATGLMVIALFMPLVKMVWSLS